MDELRKVLIELTREAGRLALKYYGRVDFQLKQDDSPVSQADREVEDFLRPRLAELLPGACFLGEETARDDGLIEAARKAEHLWVVDPIDGTAAFLDEIDNFGVSIALLKAAVPHLGVVAYPALAQVYSAVRGKGAWWVTPRGERSLAGACASADLGKSALYVPSNAHRQYHIRFEGRVRSIGCTTLQFLLCARGAAAGTLSRGHIWDWAAATVILEEAGGLIRHLDGGEIDWRAMMDGQSADPPLLAAPPVMWQTLAQAIEVRR